VVIDAKRVFFVSAWFLFGALCFWGGFLVEHYKVWPERFLVRVQRVPVSLLKFGTVAPDNLIVSPPAGVSRERLTFHDKSRLMNGYYGLLGWDDERGTYSAWLYRADGELLHTWRLSYWTLDPDGPLNGGDAPHAFWILPDGSFMVSFDWGDVMARVDPCGRPVWTKTGTYHHSLEPADDGTFWTWRGDGSAHGHRQFMVNFDPATGNTLREIELADVIRKAGPPAITFGVPADFQFRDSTADDQVNDIFHPNDVEPLHAALAGKFPGFAPGDLLISLREVNLVAVIDPHHLSVKWQQQGPWYHQHDPDFLSDGTISVFDNKEERDRSEIVKIDPSTRQISNELRDGGTRFYTASMGTHQYLPNGNVLVVVPDEGRVLELSPGGHRVLEFNNVFRNAPAYNAHIANGMWMPEGYFSTLPSCATGTR
jgi:hypothetical protein